MSTAYPPRLIKYLLTPHPTRNTALTSPPTPSFYGHLASTFGLYYAGPGTDYLSQDFYLAEGISEEPPTESEALHAVIFHKGPGSKQVTIYDGTGKNGGGKALAVGVSERRWGDGVVLKLPSEKEMEWKEERMRSKGFAAVGDHVFEFEGLRCEWREDVRTRPHTRRLVRIGTGTSREENAEPDVVAVWTEGSVPNRNWQIGWFRLIDESVTGNGYFMLLMVITVLAACHRGPAIEGTMSWHEEKMLERKRDKS